MPDPLALTALLLKASEFLIPGKSLESSEKALGIFQEYLGLFKTVQSTVGFVYTKLTEKFTADHARAFVILFRSPSQVNYRALRKLEKAAPPFYNAESVWLTHMEGFVKFCKAMDSYSSFVTVDYPGMPQLPASTIRRRLISRFCCTGLGRLTSWDDLQSAAPSGYSLLSDQLRETFLGTLIGTPTFDYEDAKTFLQFHLQCNGRKYMIRLLASIGIVFYLRLLKAEVEDDTASLDDEMVQTGEYICFLRGLKDKSGVLQHMADLAHSIGSYSKYGNFLYCKKNDKAVAGELFSNLTFYMLLYYIDAEQCRPLIPAEIYKEWHTNIQDIIQQTADAKDVRGYPTAYSAFVFYMYAQNIAGGWPPWNQTRYDTSQWLKSLVAKGK